MSKIVGTHSALNHDCTCGTIFEFIRGEVRYDSQNIGRVACPFCKLDNIVYQDGKFIPSNTIKETKSQK